MMLRRVAGSHAKRQVDSVSHKWLDVVPRFVNIQPQSAFQSEIRSTKIPVISLASEIRGRISKRNQVGHFEGWRCE